MVHIGVRILVVGLRLSPIPADGESSAKLHSDVVIIVLKDDILRNGLLEFGNPLGVLLFDQVTLSV